MAGKSEPNWGKLKELILVLSRESLENGDSGFGYVKLNKLLFRADTEAWRRLGRPITGETYIKREYGPVGSHVPIVLDELGSAGLLTWQLLEHGPHTQKIPHALQEPDFSQFHDHELSVIRDVIAELLELGGKAVSNWSHQESAGWNGVDIGEEIPYVASLIDTSAPDESVFEEFRALHDVA